MPRSPILAGLRDQRNRAKLRGKLDRRHSFNSVHPGEELIAWLKQNASIEDVSEVEILNLSNFLRNTGDIDLTPQERLRQLAIFLEPELAWRTQPRAWLALDRIYKQAIRLAPEDAYVHHSRALSAQECADGSWREDNAQGIKPIIDTAWRAAYKALSLSPKDAKNLYLLGALSYDDSTHPVEEALEFFEDALAEDDTHQWALLYRAQCLQDQERWQEAYLAYSRVDASFFVRGWEWRYELLLEQRAYCLLQSGDIEGASNHFKELLSRWSADPSVAQDLMGNYITEAVTGLLQDQLLEELMTLVERERWDWLATSSIRR